jgi:Fic family protein
MRYIYNQKGWPKLSWDAGALATQLARIRHLQGRLIGHMEGLGFTLRNEAVLRTLTQEVLTSSDIEGEKLDADQVRSSLARRLGLEIGALTPADHDVEGVVGMTVDATQRYSAPLTDERLFDWHSALFPSGRSGMSKIIVGNWRDDKKGPMQVVSGPISREKVHFQAPEAKQIPKEMRAFLKWFNQNQDDDPVVKAALAHLWFVTIHPFDDGNGRIARAITEMALARSEDSSQRFYSMSTQMRAERNAYYNMLETTQKDGLDVAAWVEWFLKCLERALGVSEEIITIVRRNRRFWENNANCSFNERQRAIINRMLDGFEGKMTTRKWAMLAKTSKDTALRDIDDLFKHGILLREPGGGRSTSYVLAALQAANDGRIHA